MLTKPAKPAERDEARPGFFKRLRARLNRGDSWLTRDIRDFMPGGKVDDELFEELETRLLMADVGVDATEAIMAAMHHKLRRTQMHDAASVIKALKACMLEILAPCEAPLAIPEEPRPYLLLMVGVNGAGKTTTIGKLARRFRDQGFTVMLAAGDTFRAAAVEQLQVWGERNDVPVVAQQAGADPAAVIFDGLQSARSRGTDVLIADTAGRLHSKTGLMDELKKVIRVIGKLDQQAPHEVMLVLDATNGQNALAQARQFREAVGVTGLTVTKLDGTAKGGVLIAIARELGLPIRFIGVGEKVEDLGVFRAEDFVDALLATDEAGSAP
jgi:fused signal recognition particle receptor